ncbi:DNA mismatch repair protein MutT [Arthrobacter sp. MYb23]|uniref:NUDIX hydrolase n=1 Tax=unclassified Arthrobacter TaxID=235627 RepID=UPI000CFA86CC|nr:MULTISPECIES: NUDIX hydrolase [unclassified Arthrobacter]PRB44494.1 DNA mismatch repair protein MutT [Arthrobacter sp. MYb51]PRB98744.1 DNA mismatch repair protein MutT [Arthrobacter sp. MYb23]
MTLQFDTRPAAYAVIVQEEKILLAYWKQDGKEGWTLPGGGLDLAEHPVDGCRREVFEETGYEARIDRMLGIDVGHWPGEIRADGSVKDFQALRLVYEATVVGGELTHEVDGSTTHAAWIPLEDIQNLNRVSLVDTALRLRQERPADGKLR